MKARLILSSGSVHQGESFGAPLNVSGETVFQTGMVGYPESLTDPSYHGQILILTFPLVGNYGVPSASDIDEAMGGLQKRFESDRVHVKAVIVGWYSDDFSHYLGESSLGAWLKREGVAGVCGVDTRAITKIIREGGSLNGKVIIGDDNDDIIDWVDTNKENLVGAVSTKTIKYYKPTAELDTGLKVLVVDVGLKFNQIRCFLHLGVSLKVVPYDYAFDLDTDYDGLFISNGPGDPSTLTNVITRLSVCLKAEKTPIFGICLGHQLLALASGAQTRKMKYGNRGHNIPCIDVETGRCYITSQNHGYEVDVTTLPSEWSPYFTNANDGSNEGIKHTTLPYFSVQFHPEATPGPNDTEFLFSHFVKSMVDSKAAKKLVTLAKGVKLPCQRVHPRKVLVLGSGGLSIGQAGEFDYSGSQAIKALKEEGVYTILINPNIATIQTSKGLADKVYFLPVTVEYVRKVIQYEQPDGIYVTFGGQTALNIGVKMKGEFSSLGVKVLGTPIETIEITEDRDLFTKCLEEIGEKMAKSVSATNVEDALVAGRLIGFPLIIRAAYALGGLGSGFAENEEELRDLCIKAFANSSQVLVEKSMKGWKEIEYEVVRDCDDNCITVCNMENFDPLGIHTGDSIVVAPSQTLSDEDYMMLRNTATNVIRHLGVVGECNIQYALNPLSKDYCIIEVNARLSRSSALASKATGYPLAFVAAKLGLGIPLTQVQNNVTKKTIACFEPSLDYCVVKMPRWDLKKFDRVSTKISSCMKSVGEVMAIGRTFEETIQKAIRAVEYSFTGFSDNDLVDNIDEELSNPTDERLFAVAKALHLEYSVDRIHSLTKIDKWFLCRLEGIVKYDKYLSKLSLSKVSNAELLKAKQMGFSDRQIATALSSTELGVRKVRKERGITPFVKQIDTVAAEFPCFTNYLYTTYNATEHDITFEDKGVMVLGSGVYRIGSSVEFDWCAVRCIRTLRLKGFKTVMVNYNPETVSTDYDEADRLYFENLTLERVLDIYELEQAKGVIVCMGGQSPNNIALPLHREKVNILGTSPEKIDGAENRYKFSRMCDKIGVDQPRWKELTSMDEAQSFCRDVGFPVLVRPSYVLSGAAMNVVYSLADLQSYLELAVKVSRDYPVVISKFIEEAKEIEMDAVAKDGKLIMHIITEHVENAGVHSGDATLILPPQDLDPETVRKIEVATAKVVEALGVTGPCNIQFIAKDNEIKIIECNVRASRSFPFVSKVLGCDLIELSTLAIMDLPFTAYPEMEKIDYVAVKVPQFSFSRLAGADPILGVEMASTGEVACFGKDKYEAYIKALIATGFKMPKKNILISIGSYREKQELLNSVIKLHELGFKLFATAGTADFMSDHNIPLQYLESYEQSSKDQKLEYSLNQHLANNMIDLYINLPSSNKFRRPASYMSQGYRSRRMAVDFDVPLITNVKCAKLFVEALARQRPFEISAFDCQTSHKSSILPGLVSIDFQPLASSNILKGGFTCAIGHGGGGGDYSSKCMLLTDISLDSLKSTMSDYPHTLVTTAKGSHLALVLFVAQISQRQIHVSDITTKDDLDLVMMAKQRIGVTCDVSIFTLFEGENYFLENVDSIDCFSTSRVSDYQTALSLLLTAVQSKVLSLDDVTLKVSSNPRSIFSLKVQPDTFIEVELDRPFKSGLVGTIHRVVLHGTTIVLDNTLLPTATIVGKDISTTTKPTLITTLGAPIKSLESPLTMKRQVDFFDKHVVSVMQYSRKDLHHLFNVAQEMKALLDKKGAVEILKGKVLCSAFYEASTRTSCSFEAAMLRLGGTVVGINQVTSSVTKGETLQDTVKTLGCYGDVIVLRHPDLDSASQAAKVSSVPIINAGDGVGEHPTQAFLDVFTIREELGTCTGLTVTVVGDLKNGRTVHSLVKLLALYGVKLNYVCPKGLEMPKEIQAFLKERGCSQYQTDNIEDVIASTDVLYVTRIQKERFSDLKEYQTVVGKFVVTPKTLLNAKEHMVVMHPLPRVDEVDVQVDFDQRAAYFRQVKYGLYVRMALLALVLGEV